MSFVRSNFHFVLNGNKDPGQCAIFINFWRQNGKKTHTIIIKIQTTETKKHTFSPFQTVKLSIFYNSFFMVRL